MFKKILIANRGEIALRIIRACRELGIQSVAVYSEADKDSLAVRFADESLCIGPPKSSESYLDAKRIISAAELTNADAIHPGYGFLAENPDFAEICESCNIAFIGPTSAHIRQMGDKIFAKKVMAEAGLPTIQGSEGEVTELSQAVSLAKSFGFPVIVKAAAGGGGRGMRFAGDEKELEAVWDTAKGEAKAAFGNDALYLEKFVENPRHVEVQILADHQGNIVHLGERDCTVQRRHQKLIEESPCPVLDDETRKKLCESAVMGAWKIGYRSAGTLEFLLDKNGQFYFMEMNTRIQVEHPVSEEVADMDLIKEQILIAAGQEISFKQTEVEFKGHAIECRINAEDPEKDFAPRPGKITYFHVPGGHGIRVDTHAYALYEVPPYYDSMIAKIIGFGKTREQAINKLLRALDEFVIEGIATTIPFHKKVLTHPDFISKNYDTSFVDKMFAEEKKTKEMEKTAVEAASSA
jgi:acetyl-CoA carboxylase biotin carboxylase subunit